MRTALPLSRASARQSVSSASDWAGAPSASATPHSSSPARSKAPINFSRGASPPRASSCAIKASLRSGPLTRLRPSRKTSRFKPCLLIRPESGYLLGPACCPRRPRHIALFVNEVKILVIALNRVGRHHLVLTFPRFRLLAHVSVTIKEVEILLVVPFQIQLLYLFSHTILDGRSR